MHEAPRRVVMDQKAWWLWPMRVADLQGVIEQARSEFIAAATGSAKNPEDRVELMRQASRAALAIHSGSPHLRDLLSDPVVMARVVWSLARLAPGDEGVAAPRERGRQEVPFDAFVRMLASDPKSVVEAFEAAISTCGFLRLTE
jgi:hypothetical protein